MGSNQIERGSRDHWTISNEDMERLRTTVAAAGPAGGGAAAGGGRGGRGGGAGAAPAAPAATRQTRPRRPAAEAGAGGRGGITIANTTRLEGSRPSRSARLSARRPAGLPDGTKFINARYVGVEVHQATRPSPPAASLSGRLLHRRTAQAGRAHVIDMFEPQDHPNDMDERGIPGPYDNAGWTLAYQMGVKVDRSFDDVTGAFKEIRGWRRRCPGISGVPQSGYLLSPSINDAFTIANRVLKANGDVYRLDAAMTEGGKSYPAGTLYVTANAASTPIVQRAVQELGVNVDATSAAPAGTVWRRCASRSGIRRPGRCPRDGHASCWSASSSRSRSSAEPASTTRRCVRSSTSSSCRRVRRFVPAAAVAGVGEAVVMREPSHRPASRPIDLRSLCEVTAGTGTGAAVKRGSSSRLEAS